MSFQHMRWLALTAVVGLAACGGSKEPADTASARSAADPALTTVSTTPASASERAAFNSADAVVQGESTAKRGTATADPVVSVAIDRKSSTSAAANLDLGAPTAAQLEQRIKNNAKAVGQLVPKAYQIGFARTVSSTSGAKSAQQLLTWSATDTGVQRATVKLSSTGATGIRLGLLVQSLPDDAVLRVFASGAAQAQQTTGAHVNTMIAANVKADGDSPAARTYWLPTTLGETTVLEVELPAGRDTSAVSISIPQLIHQAETATTAALSQLEAKTACAAMTPDASCTTPLPPAANATASMDFVENGGAYYCTGTLLANRGATQQGYFLTANHCIGNQTVASSLVTWWFYRSSACNSNVINPGTVPVTGGATLLFNRSEISPSLRNPTGTDTAFMDLVGTPPVGAVYAGWAFGRHGIDATNYVSWHNPSGLINNASQDPKMRRSDGHIASYLSFTSTNSLGQMFGEADSTNASYPMYQVRWSSGITEGGSSGSGLFADGEGSNPKIIGQLWGGQTSCSNPNGKDVFGRFDLAYENGLINWLNPGYSMVFRFYNLTNGTHFYSAKVPERDTVRASIPSLKYEDPVFAVAPESASGLSPVYRFQNKITGVHFYTINESERDTVMTYSSFIFEGIAWYARKSTSPAAGTIEVFRFMHRPTGTHLYTANVAERDNIINTMGASYAFEGVAYLAWPADI